MIKLLLKNETNYKFKYKSLFKKILKNIAIEEQIDKPGQVNLIIIDSAKMQSLYLKYKSIDRDTDVLAFPADWENLHQFIDYYEFGDIYISYNKIIDQSQKYNHSLKREWAYIFTHGVFHLLGYDHKISKDEKAMNNKVDKIMEHIKVGRND